MLCNSKVGLFHKRAFVAVQINLQPCLLYLGNDKINEWIALLHVCMHVPLCWQGFLHSLLGYLGNKLAIGLSASVNGCLSICVSPATDWHPASLVIS